MMSDDRRAETLARLDGTYVETVAREVAAVLSRGRPVEACYQPGDGTRYGLVFTPLWKLMAAPPRVASIGGWSSAPVAWPGRACDGIVYEFGATLISLVGRAAYPLNLGLGRRHLHPSYVSEKWFGGRETSSAVMLATQMKEE